MAQNIPGKLTVANDVIADMAGYAALESYGVVGMADPTLRDGIAKLLPNNRLRKGIEISKNDEGQTSTSSSSMAPTSPRSAACSQRRSPTSSRTPPSSPSSPSTSTSRA